MRIFVTGASGFVGTAVVRELIGAGHQVLGLARSDASAQKLERAGATVQRGELGNTVSLRRGAAAADGVIHTAFIHDFSNIAASGEIDKLAIAAIGEELAGSNRPFVVTSAIGLLPNGKVGTEDDSADAKSAGGHRVASEFAALSLASRGVRVTALRLPPSVHGDGDYGFVPGLIQIAREKKVSAYVGDGRSRWSAVHRDDAADLYRVALEKGTAGAIYHAIGDEGVPSREIAEAIGRGLNVPVASKPLEEARAHFAWLGRFFAADMPASSAKTRAQLGWEPTRAGLIADLEPSGYFRR